MPEAHGSRKPVVGVGERGKATPPPRETEQQLWSSWGPTLVSEATPPILHILFAHFCMSRRGSPVNSEWQTVAQAGRVQMPPEEFTPVQRPTKETLK